MRAALSGAVQRFFAAQASPNKIGAGALQASLRQGFKELGAAFGTALPGQGVQIDEPGTIGNRATPQIVTAQMTGRGIELDR